MVYMYTEGLWRRGGDEEGMETGEWVDNWSPHISHALPLTTTCPGCVLPQTGMARGASPCDG